MTASFSYLCKKLGKLKYFFFMEIGLKNKLKVNKHLKYHVEKSGDKMTHPLFSVYPGLKDKIPYISLGEFPTPVGRLSGLEKETETQDIFVKREDKSSDIYGGNKIRKLEFILGLALAKRKKHTITFGFAGSNHTLAVALFADKLKMIPISMHLFQPNARYVRKNLLYQELVGTKFHHYRSFNTIRLGSIMTMMKYIVRTGKMPLFIPPGGSSTMGVMATSGAAFELKGQIDDGAIPMPDFIYLPLGSGGTTAGLLLGIKALGLGIKIRAVAVSPRGFSNFENIKKLFDDGAKEIKKLEPTFPDVELLEEDIEISHDYLGEGYAHFNENGMDAVRLLEKTDKIFLEGTYTGKAMACLIDDARAGRLDGKRTLFWNTHNSVDFSEKIKAVDYHRLPKAYHSYFEEDFQPLETGD